MTKTKETKKKVIEKELGIDVSLLKYLKPFNEYLEEYTELTLKASEILIKGPKYMDKHKKDIYIKYMKDCLNYL